MKRRLRLNPDIDKVKKVIDLISKKDGHCPCQIEISDHTVCPCDDFYEGTCHCNLFVESDK